MRIPPLSVIETWPTPNYSDPTTRGPSSLIVNIIFISTVMVAVASRFYCRLRIKKWFGWDDIMIAMALLFTIGLTACVLLAEQNYGWDRHIWDIELSEIQNANIIAMVSKVVFTFAATFTRLSLCVFYYRLVKDSSYTWFVWTVHATIGFNVAICIAFVFLAVFLCTPVQYYWQYPPTIANGHCLNEGASTLAAGILNTVADLLVTLIPMPLVARLRLPVKQRIGVLVLFGLGFIVIVAGSVRTYYIWKALIDSYDETWYAYPLWIAAAVEIDVGVICACAPALKTLLYHARSNATVVTPSSDDTPKDPHKSSSTPSSDSRWFCMKWLNTTKATLRFQRRSQNLSIHSEGCSKDADIWPASRPKTALHIHEDEECLHYIPMLKIMRRQSVELESLRSLHTHSSLEKY